MGVILDLIGTLRTTLRISKGTIDSSALTVARTFTLPDVSGQLAIAGVGGSFSTVQVALDFGSSFVKSKSFSIADAAATTATRITMVGSASTAGGALGEDELEMDGLSCSAICLVNGTITAYVTAIPGPIRGIRNVNYALG